MHDDTNSPNLASDTAQMTESPGNRGLIRPIANHLVGRRATVPVDRRLASHGCAAGRFNSEPLIPEEPCRRVAFQFQARDHNLEVGPAVRRAANLYQVFLDGQLADGAYGVDVDPGKRGNVDEPRTYGLVRQPGTIASLFEIEFDDVEVEWYIDTLG